MIGMGSFRWGRITALYIKGGYPVADVTDREGGVHIGLKFLTLGGGSGNAAVALPAVPDGLIDLPSEAGPAEVVLVFPEEHGAARRNARPWILSGSMPRTVANAISVQTEAPALTVDYTVHHISDVVLQRDASRIAVSTMGGVVLQGNEQPVRVQMGSGGLRISSDGTANEGLLLAGPTLAYLTGLAAQVEANRQYIIRLEAWANSGAGEGSPPLIPYSAFPDPGFPATGTDEYNGPTLALESSEIAVSEKAKA